MKASIHLGKIAGVDVGIHYSWFAVLALVTWSLSDGFLPQHFRGWAAAVYWGTGIAAALLLFASVLFHELAHSLVAKARGFPVRGITLFLLGGVSNLTAESRRARDEFVISAVGPLSSLALAAAFGIATYAFQDGRARDAADLWLLTTVSVSNTPLAAVVWYLALVNLLLAAFNLLPAFPLDGGRVLRSVIWATTGSLSRATSIAARGGQVVGILLMGLGALQAFQGNFLGGLWYAFVGWFLHGAATSSRRAVTAEAEFEGIRVIDVMDRQPATIGPEASIPEAVYEHFMRPGVRSLAVCEGASLVGIITLADIKGVPREWWPRLTVRDRMTPMPLRQVEPGDRLFHAFDLLGQHSIHQAPVLEGDRLVGMLSRAHIIRYLHARKELGIN